MCPFGFINHDHLVFVKFVSVRNETVGMAICMLVNTRNELLHVPILVDLYSALGVTGQLKLTHANAHEIDPRSIGFAHHHEWDLIRFFHFDFCSLVLELLVALRG